MPQLEFVSVTLVTYNSGRFIKKCLESVLAQKYTELELIVIDNASTDGTLDILEQFEGRCRIVFNEENVGFAAAQNQAIRQPHLDVARQRHVVAGIALRLFARTNQANGHHLLTIHENHPCRVGRLERKKARFEVQDVFHPFGAGMDRARGGEKEAAAAAFPARERHFGLRPLLLDAKL